MARQANYQLKMSQAFMLRGFAKNWRNVLLCHETTNKGNRLLLI